MQIIVQIDLNYSLSFSSKQNVTKIIIRIAYNRVIKKILISKKNEC